jgi:hypothetical protein
MSLAGRKSHELEVQALHFPFGGPRFRPTIEDLFEMLITEFKIDVAVQARRILKKSRTTYFERQLESAVFDSPETAAQALRNLGFSVQPPSLL